ncbi:hypothetical protein COCVIDRAFT_94832 [Bipolaris victoriae FI3]|uniref:Uncharacterized protein n=1 Tax=Bipolaris victoriae (strain FI3) TaxID=930091 RepID=W7EXE5_BIPV3|nr:hypothetical protein COCVIDRAFT_94832 [Bipolaris victoriae FI3]
MCVQCTKRSHEQKLVGGSCAPANEGAKRCEQVRAERPSRRGLSAQCEHEQIDGVIRRGGRAPHARPTLPPPTWAGSVAGGVGGRKRTRQEEWAKWARAGAGAQAPQPGKSCVSCECVCVVVSGWVDGWPQHAPRLFNSFCCQGASHQRQGSNFRVGRDLPFVIDQGRDSLIIVIYTWFRSCCCFCRFSCLGPEQRIPVPCSSPSSSSFF